MKLCNSRRHMENLNTLVSTAFGDSHAKTTGLHMALHTCNSGAESGGELFKGLKDVASLLVCTLKNFLLGGVDFVSGGLLGHLGPLHLAMGPNQ